MKAIVAALIVLSATGTALGGQLQGGVNQTMLDPGISGGNQEPCYYGEKLIEFNGRKETIYATIRAYNHSFDKARLVSQSEVPRMFGAMSGYIQTQQTYKGPEYLNLYITKLFSSQAPNDYIALNAVIVMNEWREVACPSQAPKKTAPRRSNRRIADCDQFLRQAESIPPSPRPVGKCQLMCMYQICRNNDGVTSSPLFNQCGPKCE
jgi:hypothetical protein